MPSTNPPDRAKWTRASLLATAAMPVVYFATQLAAALFYPGYSFSHQVASMLGTQDSRHPWIFNTGAVLTGLLSLTGAIGFFRALRSVSNDAAGFLIALALACNGVLSVKAGLFPIPDPRHASWGFLMLPMILSPLVLLLALWRNKAARWLRVYLGLDIALLIVLVPFMSRKIVLPWLGVGLLQRCFVAAIFFPVAMGALWLLHRRTYVE